MPKAHKVPFASLNGYLSGYRAKLLPEYSTNQEHVYYSGPLRKWITVQKRGNNAVLKFLDYCPCGVED